MEPKLWIQVANNFVNIDPILGVGFSKVFVKNPNESPDLRIFRSSVRFMFGLKEYASWSPLGSSEAMPQAADCGGFSSQLSLK